MNRRHALGLLGGLGFSSCRQSAALTRWSGVLFGIPVHINFMGGVEGAQSLGEKALAFIQPYEQIFSLWEENSELSVLNREHVLSNPSDAMLNLLQKAGELHENSHGLFDPTIHSYLAWLKTEHAEGRSPDAGEARLRREFVNFSRVEVSQNEIRIPDGFSLDLNAIVQGYVTDLVGEFLTEKCESALVNFGEYRIVGSRSYAVEVGSKMVQLTRALAVSSGGGERLSATITGNHLINPESGLSPEPKKIFAVEADEAWLADGLATIIAVGGSIPETYHDVKVIRI